MPAAISLSVGDVYGRLTVLEKTATKLHGSPAWSFLCTCGSTKLARASDVKRGLIASCGCLAHEVRANCEPIQPGSIYGNWTVIEELPRRSSNSHRYFSLVCTCGNKGEATLNALTTGHSRSCGCLMKEELSARFTTHGMTGTRTYNIWNSMVYRATKESNRNKHYVGRGITVCESWKVFENFYADMGEAPEGLTLDRTDNDGNYCKENCRWATNTQQARNKQRKGKLALGVKQGASGKYYAKIKDSKGASIHLGTFDTYEEAVTYRAIQEANILKGEPPCKKH